MSTAYTIDDARGSRRLTDDDFPLILGGPESDVDLGEETPAPRAYLGLSEGGVFVQGEAGGPAVTVNGSPLRESHWLADGDVLGLVAFPSGGSRGDVGARITVEARSGETCFVVRREAAKSARVPVLQPPPRPPDGAGAGRAIQALEFQPKKIAAVPAANGSTFKPARRGARPGLLLSAVLLLALLAVTGFVFGARSVLIEVEPSPDELEVQGLLPDFEIRGRRLLLPGRYTVLAVKEGYRGIEETVEVTAASQQEFRFVLDRLPGFLVLRTLDGAEVFVDGEAVGTAPLPVLELAPGEHDVLVRAKRHEDFHTVFAIGGGGAREELSAELLPRWAAVTFSSEPAGAAIRVDGQKVGTTPVVAEVLAGSHGYELVLGGYKPHRGRFEVKAREPRELPPARLEETDGMLVVRSEPSGATVTVAGVYRGTTPLDLELAPGEGYGVEVSKAGFVPAGQEVRILSGETRELDVELDVREGEVLIAAVPPEAQVFVDGQLRGQASRTYSLQAVPHDIEIRLAGYQPFRQQLTPMPGVPQSIEVTLLSEEQVKARANPPEIETSEGHKLRLIKTPGRFVMGASRREPGRRANEALREVELTQSFYLATAEVENRQFRRFKSEHLSGQLEGGSLETDHHPAVRVSWEEAVAYCNWLSRKEGLKPFYRPRGASYVPANPPTTGYRLPTEAEWSWAARFAAGPAALKYPWGKSLPIPPASGNYADRSALGILPGVLPEYNDGFQTTAPVTEFEPNGFGIKNLGGNVAEWAHDVYAVRPVIGPGKVETDPMGPEEGELHVLRGSSWMHSTVTELRLTFRDYAKDGRPDVGFRIARNVESTE